MKNIDGAKLFEWVVGTALAMIMLAGSLYIVKLILKEIFN